MTHTVLANEYSGEHVVRSLIVGVMAEHGYAVARYSLADKGTDERILTIVAIKPLSGVQTSLNFNSDPGQHPDNV
jgi:hypothetical protein